tara:strand:+ start:618 stop:2237 length:1620 start_codon:yes stop_codon:yes gene_type:complete
MADITGIFNTSAFDGTITSDFLQVGNLSPQTKASRIDYSVADFEEYRTALLNYLQAIYPLEYNNFVESDLGIMLVEMFSYLASVLSLKADMLANESYLSSVQSPENLRKLLQLIGIALKGPISAKSSCTATLATADTLVASSTATIAFADRSFSVPNNKDTGLLTYTIYEVDDTGAIDLTTENLVLGYTDSLNNGGSTFSKLILLEGQLKKVSGTFSDTNSVQTITLTDTSIVEGSLYVKTGGETYNEVQNLFLADATDKVFSKTYTDEYAAILAFGDDTRGKSPSPGDTYDVYYRVGGGSRGNIAPGVISISIPATHTDNGAITVTATNPTKATGGLNAETVEHAKKWSPYFFKTQYRAVTGEDYTAFANQFVSTVGQSGKSSAVLRNSGAGSNMIDIYTVAFADEVDGVQAQLERSSLAYKNELLTYLNKYKMLTDEVTIVDGLIRTLDLKTTIFIDTTFKPFEEDIKRAASAKMLSFFDLSKREFGERVRVDELNRELFTIPEIRFSKLDNLTQDIKLNFNEILQLNNLEINVEYV